MIPPNKLNELLTPKPLTERRGDLDTPLGGITPRHGEGVDLQPEAWRHYRQAIVCHRTCEDLLPARRPSIVLRIMPNHPRSTISMDGITQVRFDRAPTCREARVTVDDVAANFTYDRRLWDLSKAAFVASVDLAHGELRVVEVFREENGHTFVRVFRTHQYALAWLNK